MTLAENGDIWAAFASVGGGIMSPIGSSVVIGSGYEPGDWWHARVEVLSAEPTILRARMWKDGEPEPEAWQLESEDATPSLQVSASVVKIGVWVGQDAAALPMTVAFDDVLIAGQPYAP